MNSQKFRSYSQIILALYLFTLPQCTTKGNQATDGTTNNTVATTEVPAKEKELADFRISSLDEEADAISAKPSSVPPPPTGRHFDAPVSGGVLQQIQSANPDFNTEAYDRLVDNAFLAVTGNPLSTFSIDVDTASYSNLRRFLNQGTLPPKDAVRIEEMINYFTYQYAQPDGDKPFATHVEMAEAPWAPEHRLVKIGIKGKEIPADKRPASNLVFLIDVSGSMDESNKLPLLVDSFKMLTNNLSTKDSVAMVVYAGASGVVLPATKGNEKEKILGALDSLKAGGSTNGGQGIELAYKIATENFIKGGSNRVILATDGDFNVGVSNQGDLTRLIEEKAKSGVFLSVLGFGMGNYKDSNLEKLADKGNGNYAYIDTLNEARKVLVEQMGGTLFTIAKDVKIQVEFNPALVGAYRLIGYENRMLKSEDFNNDKIDAGDIGAGHTVTALYEIVPAGQKIDLPGVDPLKYQQPSTPSSAVTSGEMLTVKLRYKDPQASESQLISYPVVDQGLRLTEASSDLKFAAAVASFGMVLRDSPYKGNSKIDDVIKLAQDSLGEDASGYRAEFLSLVHKAKPVMESVAQNNIEKK